MRHWSSRYVGAPWAPDADGPVHFSCWGLVRHVYRERHGIELPHVVIEPDRIDEGALANVVAIKESARLAGMKPLSFKQLSPKDEDVVIMRSNTRLHCGIVVRVNHGIRVLHSSHEAGVLCERWDDAILGMVPELWRRG
jgi:cell wall-associated NlpC family hydrolase